jgi:hypothetical protein
VVILLLDKSAFLAVTPLSLSRVNKPRRSAAQLDWTACPARDKCRFAPTTLQTDAAAWLKQLHAGDRLVTRLSCHLLAGGNSLCFERHQHGAIRRRTHVSLAAPRLAQRTGDQSRNAGIAMCFQITEHGQTVTRLPGRHRRKSKSQMQTVLLEVKFQDRVLDTFAGSKAKREFWC